MSSQNPASWTDEANDLLTEDERISPDDINLKVQQAQSALIELKRQQDDLERQKKELEELSRKQRELEEGRRDIFEKLTRGLVLLERQEFEARREAEQIQLIRENFEEQLGHIGDIKPQEWTPAELQSELTRSLAIIDQAQAIHSQARTRLEVLRDEPGSRENLTDEEAALNQGNKSFGTLFKEGFAFTLPIMVFIFLLVLISLLHH